MVSLAGNWGILKQVQNSRYSVCPKLYVSPPSAWGLAVHDETHCYQMGDIRSGQQLVRKAHNCSGIGEGRLRAHGTSRWLRIIAKTLCLPGMCSALSLKSLAAQKKWIHLKSCMMVQSLLDCAEITWTTAMISHCTNTC